MPFGLEGPKLGSTCAHSQALRGFTGTRSIEIAWERHHFLGNPGVGSRPLVVGQSPRHPLTHVPILQMGSLKPRGCKDFSLPWLYLTAEIAPPTDLCPLPHPSP